MQRGKFARWAALALAIGCWASVGSAAIRLPSVIGDNMVLQRGQPVPIWGWATPGDDVTVHLASQALTAKADDNGRWKVTLAELDVGDPLTLTIKDSSGTTIVLVNILVGDVWVCSGQSNMEMGVGMCDNGKEEIAAADYPAIRLFTVAKTKTFEPVPDVNGAWAACTPGNIAKCGTWGGFSGVAYFFGRRLHKELNVPIGLISTSWGGTPAEFWTSSGTLAADPATAGLVGQGDSGNLYNGMIAPLIPYAIRGAIWYQGESNVVHAHQYRTLFPAMIRNWRHDWQQGDFPFGFVQIAPWELYKSTTPDGCAWAELCEAQRMTLDCVPNTGMAVTMDIGDVMDIHPKNKQEVGRRLALWALAKVYDRDVEYSGPIYKSMAIEGNCIRLEFDYVGQGLIASDGKPLSEFTIAGADQKFVPAVAEIDGTSIVVHNDAVDEPVAVRFAWRDDAQPNLANKAGLPASPFRTDTWKGVTEGK